MSDPTITVTNLGEQGVDSVFGVIYPQQVAIVGFGKPAQRVVVVDGGIRVATTVQASLAADHRASDGALSDAELLRDQVDLDSMDWLNFLVRLNKRFAVDIPESQYASLRTIDDLTGYIGQHR